MQKPNLLILMDPEHYALRNLAQIKDEAEITITHDEEQALASAPNADAILYAGMPGTRLVNLSRVFAKAPRVRWIHSLSAGVEKVLFPELIASPIPLTNARGVFKRSLAEFVVMGLFYFSKRVRRLVENQRAHKWDNFSVEFLTGKTMGIVGYGEIGRECALLAKPLGVKIYASRRNPGKSDGDALLDKVFAPDQLLEMLAECDAVVAAAPLTPETKHLLSERAFQAMKPSVIVMNVGRGPVVHEQALIEALQSKRIAGAALDVFEQEPLAPESPLWDMENVLISPHCTDRTVNPDWLDLSMQLFVDNFRRFKNGEPLQNIVNKKAGY